MRIEKEVIQLIANTARKLIGVFEILKNDRKIAIAADWSEIFGYCFPLVDAHRAYQKKNPEYYKMKERARFAEALLFTSILNIPIKVFILPPHIEEYLKHSGEILNFLLNQEITKEEIKLIQREASKLKRNPEFKYYFDRYKDGKQEISKDDLLKFAGAFAKDLYSYTLLNSGKYSEGLAKLDKLVLSKEILTLSKEYTIEIQERIDSIEVEKRRRKISEMRGRRKPNKHILTDDRDSLAIEYVKKINETNHIVGGNEIFILFSSYLKISNEFNSELTIDICIPGQDTPVPVTCIWDHNDLIAFEVFRENGDWEASENMARSFCDDYEEIIKSLNKINKNDYSNLIIPSRKMKSYIDLINQYENLKIIKREMSERIYEDFVVHSLPSVSMVESELLNFTKEFFSLINENNFPKHIVNNNIGKIHKDLEKVSKSINEIATITRYFTKKEYSLFKEIEESEKATTVIFDLYNYNIRIEFSGNKNINTIKSFRNASIHKKEDINNLILGQLLQHPTSIEDRLLNVAINIQINNHTSAIDLLKKID